MVIYECDNCKKTFNQKGHYMRHLNRKYPCKKTEQNLNLTDYSINEIHIPKLEYNNTCIYCKKTYSTKSCCKNGVLTSKLLAILMLSTFLSISFVSTKLKSA